MSATVSRLESGRLDAAAEQAQFLEACAGDGAVASFTGLVRPMSADGQRVEALFLDHHPRLTAPSLERIGADAATRFGAARVAIVHRCGRVAAGDSVVFVAAAAAHRRAALEAVHYMIDRLKTDAVLWKREEGPGGARWIEPVAADRTARADWGDEHGGD